ncbi:MAG: peptidylprolyl isomerase [Nitrospiraceae bacterium]
MIPTARVPTGRPTAWADRAIGSRPNSTASCTSGDAVDGACERSRQRRLTFFICVNAANFLDQQCTVFGEVEKRHGRRRSRGEREATVGTTVGACGKADGDGRRIV